MWSKVPGLVNTLNNEGQMDEMLRQTDEKVSFTSVLVPTLSWDPMTDKEILTSVGNTWVEGASGLMPREGKKFQFWLKFPKFEFSITFPDVARFMVSVAENPQKWHRKAVAVTTKYTKEEESSGFERLFAKFNEK